jgi:hypothetical protein
LIAKVPKRITGLTPIFGGIVPCLAWFNEIYLATDLLKAMIGDHFHMWFPSKCKKKQIMNYKKIRSCVVKVWLLSLVTLGSCKIHSTGRTYISPDEQIEVETIGDSKVKVRVENFSQLNATVFQGTNEIVVPSNTNGKIWLTKDQKLIVQNKNSEHIELQVRYFLFFKNNAKITRKEKTYEPN